MIPSAADERSGDRLAGVLAIAGGLCWIAWAIANTVSRGAFEHSPEGSTPARCAALLTAGWNLFLIPAALRLCQMLRAERPALVPIWSAAGILSLSFWAFGGLTTVTRPLETTYLALAATWLLGIGSSMRSRHAALSAFTLVVGGFTAIDAVFSLFEPMPFALYVLAAPKLPLSALWSFAVGAALLRRRVLAAE